MSHGHLQRGAKIRSHLLRESLPQVLEDYTALSQSCGLLVPRCHHHRLVRWEETMDLACEVGTPSFPYLR